jgi:hypothetical protein
MLAEQPFLFDGGVPDGQQAADGAPAAQVLP